MAVKTVAIRYKGEGGETIVKQMMVIGDAGDEAGKKWSASFNRAASDGESAARRQAAALEKLNALGIGPDPATINRAADAQGRLAGETGRSGTAFASAAPQIQDFIVQATMGGNVIQALVVQGGQLAGQLVYVEGKVGAVASALMGPFGIAAQVALMVLAPFVSKLIEGNQTLDDQVKKLEEDGRQTEQSRQAQEAYKNTLTGRIELQRKLNDELDRSILTERQLQELKVGQAAAQVYRFRDDLSTTQRDLKQAQDDLRRARQQLDTAAMRDPDAAFGAGAAVAAAEARVAALTKQRDTVQQQMWNAERATREARIPILQSQVEAQSSATKAAESRLQDVLGELNKQRAANQITETEYSARLAQARKVRDDAVAAAQESSRKARDSETLTAAQVAKMLHGELPGVRVTNGLRSAAENKAVRGAANSYHLRNQAVDFVPAGGMGSMTKDDVRRIFESRGINVVELLGPGDKGHSDHFHVAWTKGKHSLDEFTDAAKRAKESAEELTSLRLFTNGDAIGRALVGARDAVARQKGEFDRAARDVLQYDSNPLAGIVGEYDAQQRVEVDRWNEENARRVTKQRDDIAMLSNLWQTGFSGGAKGVWDIFRQQGMQVLSELLARWMVMGNLKGAFGEGGVSTGIFGAIGKLVNAGARLAGGSAAYSNPSASWGDLTLPGVDVGGLATASVPRFAVGTHYSSAGAALVGENGPELVSLPRGSRVTPAAETRRMLAAGNDNRPVEKHYHFTGNLMTPEFWAQIQQSDDIAAARGAAGGASIGQAEMRAQSARRLGRNWR